MNGHSLSSDVILSSLDVGAASDLLVANHQTGSLYNLVLSDRSKVIECDNSGAVTIQVPSNSAVTFPIGTVIEIYQMGSGQVTITVSGGVVLRAPHGTKTATQYSLVTLWKRDTDEWVLSGDVVP